MYYRPRQHGDTRTIDVERTLLSGRLVRLDRAGRVAFLGRRPLIKSWVQDNTAVARLVQITNPLPDDLDYLEKICMVMIQPMLPGRSRVFCMAFPWMALYSTDTDLAQHLIGQIRDVLCG